MTVKNFLHKDDRLMLALSQFERLPKEIVFNIIECVPEAVLDIRLTSRILQSRVDEFVKLQATIPLIHKLETINRRVAQNDTFWHSFIDVLVYVPKCKSRLFHLRANLRESPSEWCEPFTCKGIWQNYIKIREEAKKEWTVFHTRFRPSVDEETVQAYVLQCAGRQINSIVLNEAIDVTITPISRLLKPFIFDKIDVETSTLSDAVLEHLKKMIIYHGVEQVSLNVKEVEAIEPVDVLLDLSSLVRSLYIWQPELQRIGWNKYFFGVHDHDWAATVLEMFSRKLDKLFIDNQAYPGFLTRDCANALIEKLPLVKKPIWFTTTFWTGEILNHTLNNTFVYVCKSETRRLLSIKHQSRLAESFRDSSSGSEELDRLFSRFRTISFNEMQK